jgi:hypothetical protein
LDRPGKKLLATGNGRCNYTNAEIKTVNYHGKDPGFVEYALNAFTNEDAVVFSGSWVSFPALKKKERFSHSAETRLLFSMRCALSWIVSVFPYRPVFA